ncbi:GntR family transcriptional regulator [Geothrix limicola]|uniref:GntR family transcriptional regulator n=2 Tax=Geothrix limicola TaxID=2927978 RepID=A0ABQ5QG04_9BACT|nr:GntR family transcriptional regulator [Geothrix limicola]
MRARDLLLTLDDSPELSLGQRIVNALHRAILEGRLTPGTALPGSRVLADRLGVHRQTVVSALQDLEAQGWLVTLPNRGTFVAEELPSQAKRSRVAEPTQGSTSVGFDLPSLLQPVSTHPSGALLLADGAADPRLAPAVELSRGYQRAMLRHGSKLLQDRDPLGTPLLRETLAAWISERHGIRVEPERILITRGSRGALNLVAHSLFRPNDLAAVENPGNRGAWDIFQRDARLGLRPVPIDQEGMDPIALEELLTRERIRLLFLMARRQFPTGASLSRKRGAAILSLAQKYRLAVVEDDYDGEFTYTDQRPEPLLAQDTTGQVLHIGSLSRLLAPGLRLGYMVFPAALSPILARVRRNLDEHGDPVLEWALADLIRDGELARHLRKTRKIYMSRRDHLVALLRDRLGDHLDVDVPEGGMGLWIHVRPGIDPDAWIRSARAHGLVLNSPSHFFLGTPEPAFRMGFAQANEGELQDAVERLARALTAIQGS